MFKNYNKIAKIMVHMLTYFRNISSFKGMDALNIQSVAEKSHPI
jgi:hypothetical protein